MLNIHHYSLCRDDSYSDQVLERQADMIRYLKQHNVQLGKRLLALTEENSMLKANRWAGHKKHWANQKESSIPGDCAMWYLLVNAVALTGWANHAYSIYMYHCVKTLVLYYHTLPFLGTKHLLYSVLLCRHQYYIFSLISPCCPGLRSVYCMDLVYTSVDYLHIIEPIFQCSILLCTGKLYACVITLTIVLLNLYICNDLFIDN